MRGRPTFHAEQWTFIPRRGALAVTKLDRDTEDFGHLVDQEVVIDGLVFRCIGVEKRVHSSVHRIGEPIGLLVPYVE